MVGLLINFPLLVYRAGAKDVLLGQSFYVQQALLLVYGIVEIEETVAPINISGL